MSANLMTITKIVAGQAMLALDSVSLEDVHDAIVSDAKIATMTKKVRAAKELYDLEGGGNKKHPAYVALGLAKQALPTLVPGGLIEGGIAKSENRIKFSNLMSLDFDDLSDPAAFRESLKDWPHIVQAFISPSGTGVKAFATLADCESVEQWDNAFQAIAADCEERGHKLDATCRNFNRLTFISHDPDAWFRPSGTPLKVTQKLTAPKPTPKPKAKPIAVVAPTSDIPDVLNVRFKPLCADIASRWKSGGYPSQSEADFALAMEICVLTVLPDERAALFMSSPLWRDHRKMTLALSKAGEKAEKESNLKVDFSTETVQSYLEALKPVMVPADRPFPIHCFPLKARNMALEIARVADGRSVELAAVSILSAYSAALGAGLRMPVKGSLVATPTAKFCYGNLFILTGAQSGTGKGTSFSPAMAPLEHYASEKSKTFAEDVRPRIQADLKVALRNLESAVKQASGSATQSDRNLAGDAEIEVGRLTRAMQAAPRVHVKDITIEALVKVMNTQPGGALATLSSESRSLMNAVGGRYREAGGGDESTYCSGYSCEGFTVDRVREGASYEVERSCLTLHWMVQPDMIEKSLENSDLMQSGFLARCLLSVPQAEPASSEWYPDELNAEIVESYRKAIRRLLETFHASGASPVSLRVAHGAAVVLHGFDEECKGRQRSTGDCRDIPAFAARWAENSMRVTLVLHAMKHGAKAVDVEVSPQSASDAVEILRWFVEQQLAVLAPYRKGKGSSEKTRLVEILTKADGKMTVRDLERRHRITKGMLDRLLELFPESFELVIVKRKGPGQPSKVVRLV